MDVLSHRACLLGTQEGHNLSLWAGIQAVEGPMEWNVVPELRVTAPFNQLPRIGVPGRGMVQPNFFTAGCATLDLFLDNKDGPLQARLEALKQEGHWAMSMRDMRS